MFALYIFVYSSSAALSCLYYLDMATGTMGLQATPAHEHIPQIQPNKKQLTTIKVWQEMVAALYWFYNSHNKQVDLSQLKISYHQRKLCSVVRT